MSSQNRKVSTVAREIVSEKDSKKAKKYFNMCLNVLKSYNAYEIYNNAYLLFNMCLDSIKGKYKIQKNTLIMVIAVVLYIVAPLDFIPDCIPGLGQVDDIGILVYVINSCSSELALYATWRERQAVNNRR